MESSSSIFEPYCLKAGRVLMTNESVRNSSPDGKGYIAGGFGVDLCHSSRASLF